MLRRLLLDVRPLRDSAEFRVAFTARVVSLFGLGMAAVALAAQLYDYRRSTIDVAIGTVIMSAAVLIGSLAGGVLADRSDRRRLILVARAAAGLAFAALAVNAFVPGDRLWVIFVAVAWDGLASGVSVTALMSVLPSLVRPDQLPAAGALMSLSNDLASIVAPMLGGVLLAAAGFGWVYAVTAVAVAATTVMLLRLRPLPPVVDENDDDESDTGGLRAAFRFARHEPVVGGLLVLGAFTALFTMPVVLFPAIVDTRFGNSDLVLGALFTAPAVGAVLVSATSGWIGRVARPGVLLLGAVFVSGLGMIVFGLSTQLAPVLIALAVVGAAGTIYEILEYALVQHATPDRYRGRIISVITAEETTADMLGDAEAALIARWFSPGAAAVVNGVVCAAAAVLAAVFVPALHRATLPAEEPADVVFEKTAP